MDIISSLVVTCVLMVKTPDGNICIKPDGNITLPEKLEVTEASKQFWIELSKVYPIVLREYCSEKLK